MQRYVLSKKNQIEYCGRFLPAGGADVFTTLCGRIYHSLQNGLPVDGKHYKMTPFLILD